MSINQDVQQKALQEAQKRLQMLQFLRRAASCLGQGSLGLFFLTSFNAFLMRSNPYLEDAELEFNDSYAELRVRIPIHKEDFTSFDFIPSMAQLIVLQFANPKVIVNAKDELVRTIASAEAIILRKIYPEVEIEGLSKEDEDKVYKCWPWLRRDTKAILKLIETKVNRNMCKERKRCKLLEELLKVEEDASKPEGEAD